MPVKRFSCNLRASKSQGDQKLLKKLCATKLKLDEREFELADIAKKCGVMSQNADLAMKKLAIAEKALLAAEKLQHAQEEQINILQCQVGIGQNRYWALCRLLQLFDPAHISISGLAQFDNQNNFVLVNPRPGKPVLPQIKVTRYCRFSNNIYQLIVAIYLAKKIGQNRVYTFADKMLAIEPDARFDDLLLTTREELSLTRDEILLGHFFYNVPFDRSFYSELFEAGPLHRMEIAKKYVKPLLKLNNSISVPAKDLVVHFRSGDLFKTREEEIATKEEIHRNYYQPPFAYYKYAIEHHLAAYPDATIVMVFEDERNPCVRHTRQWLRGCNIPFVNQSASLADDYAYIMGATNLVCARGSFNGPAMLMSDNLKTMYVFDRVMPFQDLYDPDFTSHLTVHRLTPAEGTYIAFDDWYNRPEQLRLMLRFSEQNLVHTTTEAGVQAGKY